MAPGGDEAAVTAEQQGDRAPGYMSAPQQQQGKVQQRAPGYMPVPPGRQHAPRRLRRQAPPRRLQQQQQQQQQAPDMPPYEAAPPAPDRQPGQQSEAAAHTRSPAATAAPAQLAPIPPSALPPPPQPPPPSEAPLLQQQPHPPVRLPPHLSKFAGLARERGRPWQGPLIAYLCLALPPPACYVYQEMRVATLQHLLAKRCSVEKGYRSHREGLRFWVARAAAWEAPVRGGPCDMRG